MNEEKLWLYVALLEINAMLGALGEIMVQKGICTAEEVLEMIDAVKKTEPLNSKLEAVNKTLDELEQKGR